MTVTCPLCGARFEPEAACSASCPMAGATGGCGYVRCPNCGSDVPDPERSALARLLRRWLGDRGRGDDPPR